MNLIVKRFFVMALPLLMASTVADQAYSIRVENNAGIEFDHVAITSDDHEFNFGNVSDGATTGLGHADLQFGKQQPKSLEVTFQPKNDSRRYSKIVELPDLGEGDSVKLSINSYLDLIRQSKV
jgi:hypothetical protein